MQRERVELEVGGRGRRVVVVRPDEPTGTAIFMAFHGSGGTGEQLLDALEGQYGAFLNHGIVVFPDAYGKLWNDARRGWNPPSRRGRVDDVAFVLALASELGARYGVDPARLYVFGHSNGASLVIRLLHEAAASLAGAGIIGAGLPEPDNLLAVDNGAVPLPTAIIHGTHDPLVPYGGGRNSLFGLQPRGRTRSIRDTARYFAARSGVAGDAQLDDLGAEGKTSVTRTLWGAESPTPVALFTVNGGGHTMPGPNSYPFILGHNTQVIETVPTLLETWGFDPQPA